MGKLRTLNDDQLLLLLKEGNTAAFLEMHERYFRQLYVYALRFLQDEEESKDIVQDIFVSLYIKHRQLSARSLRSFLYASVRNRALDQLERLKVRADYWAKEHTKDYGRNSTDDAYNYQELVSIIEDTLDQLPQLTREVFVRSKMDDLSHKEIAQELNLSKDVVKKQVSRALRVLRTKLQIFIGIFY